MVVGIICIVLASIAFGIGPVFAKELIILGYDTIDILLYPKISTLLVIGIILLLRRNSLKLTKPQLWQMLLFCGACNGITALLLIEAYAFIPIGLATMFHFIYPVIVTIIMVALFKERLTVFKVLSIICAVAGLCLILDLSGNMSLLGVILALGSGVAYAIYVIANKKSAYKDLPVLVVVFYSSLINFLALAIVQLSRERFMLPSTGIEWGLITACGLMSGLFAFFVMINGIRRIGASNAAIVNMLEPITALVAGAIIYGDRIKIIAFIGCILVLLAIVLLAMRNDQEAKKSSYSGPP